MKMKCTPEMCPPDCCDMRGMLSFMILWLLQKKDMYGDEMAQELGKMKGGKPTPGTIYPALKQLKEKGQVTSRKEGKKVIYSLTEKGQKGIKEAIDYFCNAFGAVFMEFQQQKTSD
ncbi:MAG: PadR family transcriptional regulator [Candidatus Hydrothermarchaeales archaeon]